MNKRRKLIVALGAGALAISLPSHAQQATKVYRVGYVSASAASNVASGTEAFRQQLRQLGYDEKNMTIEFRFSDGDLEQLRASVIELVRLKVDVMVTTGPSVTRIARDVTSTVPIVMMSDTDPVGMRFVKSLPHPGGNITGLTSLSRELVGKQLELLKELIPRLARIAILWNPAEPGIQQSLHDTRSAAMALGMHVQLLEQRGSNDLGPAFDAAKRGRAQALIVLKDFSSSVNRSLLIKRADQNKIPAIYWEGTFVDAGGLLSYAAIREDLARHAAGFVDKILKGANAGDLPIEQPTKFELVINRKTAKALGLTIPQSLLISADKVIE